MENRKDVFAAGENLVLQELKKLFTKPTISPAETEAAKNAVCLLIKMDEACGNMEMYDGYSGSTRPYREYAITSYASPNMPVPMSMTGPMTYEHAMRRPYSRHSINDRAVEKLQQLMDTAESDYERQKVKEFIRYIRNDEMTG